MPAAPTQRDLAKDMLHQNGMVRLSEFKAAGITAATITRMHKAGDILRLGRGLYQLPDAEFEVHHALAEAAKRVPRGVICLVSALAYYGLTDQLPREVWMAIGNRDWTPKADDLSLRFVKFTKALMEDDVETVSIEDVDVKIFSVSKTVADCFRHRRTIGLPVAIEGLQEALRLRQATPAELARAAKAGGVSTVMRPYLEALTANG